MIAFLIFPEMLRIILRILPMNLALWSKKFLIKMISVTIVNPRRMNPKEEPYAIKIQLHLQKKMIWRVPKGNNLFIQTTRIRTRCSQTQSYWTSLTPILKKSIKENQSQTHGNSDILKAPQSFNDHSQSNYTGIHITILQTLYPVWIWEVIKRLLQQ